MCIELESRKICVAGNQCDNRDFDFHNAEHKELPEIKIPSDEGREDCQQLKPKGTLSCLGTTVIAVTILLILSILFRRATVKMYLVFYRALCFSCNCVNVYCDAVHVRYSASGNCVIFGDDRGNESIVQEENCFVEEMKEVELRSRRGKFIYNRTYNPGQLG